MSVQPCKEPICTRPDGPAELVIAGRERDLGGFSVRRVLPAAERRMIGPFIFFDEMGPAVFEAGHGIDVRPHPHIGIATVTYLFEGEIVHRDGLGFEQLITPGAVNLMTAGRGIVHSERAGADRAVVSRMHGIQSWMALPDGLEEMEPAFVHYPAAALPSLEIGGARIRVILGEAYGARSPVTVYSPIVYAEALLPRATTLALPDGYSERAFFVVGGRVAFGDAEHGPGVMVLGRAGDATLLTAREDSRVMLVGGEPVGPREIDWNFVARSTERIERAKAEWRAGGFTRIAGDPEFIPLPGE